MPNSIEQLIQTLEGIRSSRFPEISAVIVTRAVDIQRQYPSHADRDIAQRKLDDLVDESLKSAET
jgi:hypothetical protein